MKISELIIDLHQILTEYGDIPILLSDRYAHYDIKRVGFSDAIDGPHVCIRMQDSIKYENN